MKGFITEFKQFIARGNVMDMAVGIIVGGAFTSIVNSLVNDIITPLIQLLTGGSTLAPSLVVAGINFGGFIGQIINFLIVAFVVFCLVKAVNTMRDKAEALSRGRQGGPDAAEKPAPTCPFCLEEVPSRFLRTFRQPPRPAVRCGYSSSSVTSR